MPASLLVCYSGTWSRLAAQGATDVPAVVWNINSDADTTLVLPYGAVVDRAAGSIFIADLRAPGIIEISGDSGRVRRLIGRLGDGPGEMRVPQRVAISPNGRLLAVYDVARRTVDIYDRQWHPLRRDPVGGFNFLKAFAVTNDTSLVFSGGRVGAGQVVVGVTWITPNGVFGLGPFPPDDPTLEEADRLDSRLYAGGGPGILQNGSFLVADAISGDVYRSTPTGSIKVAAGPPASPEVFRGIITKTTTADGPTRTVHFGFRQAALIEPADGGAIVYFTDEAKQVVEVYRLRAGFPARLIKCWKLRASILIRYDDESLIAIDHFVGGWRIVRVRIPRTR